MPEEQTAQAVEEKAPEKEKRKRKTPAEAVWAVFRFLILFGLGFVIMYPLLYMISCSFRERADMNDPTVVWIPRHFTLSVMKDTVQAMDFGNTLLNTVLMNVGCSMVQVLSCAITGYGFARFRFRGSKLLFGLVILMILVPTQVIALPLYGQFRFFGFGSHTVNLIDTMWTMYLPAMTANGIRAGLMIFLFRQFFKGLPREIEDAAYIDGCGPFMTFVRVMAPNASAAFLTVFLFSLVWYWNDYYQSTIYLSSYLTVSTNLANLKKIMESRLGNEVAYDPYQTVTMIQACSLLTLGPLLAIYLIVQRSFVAGVERTGIVG